MSEFTISHQFVVPSLPSSDFSTSSSDDHILVSDSSWTLDDSSIPSLRFPQKLWRIVNECRTGAISWGSNGQTIRLHYNRFQEEYLTSDASIFKTTNIASFIRQLNLYGFRKIATNNTREPNFSTILHQQQDVHEFVHEHFREGRLDLLSRVCRKTGAKKNGATSSGVKAGGKRKVIDVDIEDRTFIRVEPVPEMVLMTSEIKEETIEVVESGDEGFSQLQMCRLALTQALEQATLQYKREKLLLQLANKNILRGTSQSNYESMSVSSTMNHVEILHDISSDSQGNLQIVEDSSTDIVDGQEKNQWKEVLSLSEDRIISISVPY